MTDKYELGVESSAANARRRLVDMGVDADALSAYLDSAPGDDLATENFVRSLMGRQVLKLDDESLAPERIVEIPGSDLSGLGGYVEDASSSTPYGFPRIS